MRTIEKFLSDLADLDIKLWVESVNGADQREVRLRCQAPKGTLTSDLRTQISERKAEIIAFLQQTSLDSNFSSFGVIPPVYRENLEVPLSSAQARLWLLDQLQGQSATYNMPGALQIAGSLNVYAFEQALKEIVRRHEVLHTHFNQINGTPVQVIDPEASVALPIIDLQGLSDVEQSTQVQHLCTLEAQKPFNLSQSPLLRVTLLRLHQNYHVLVLVMHHIVSDAWSIEIFIQELSTLYVALASGKPNPLPELPIQYADFAVWQQKLCKEQVLETQLNYWQQHLAGAPPLLELPITKSRPASQTFCGSSWEWKLGLELTQKLNAISGKSGGTLFMTLLAAFVTLLARYSGQDDILIGTPIANRNRLEIEPLIGFFVNTLVLRPQIQGNPSFEEYLKQVQQVTLQAYEHQDVPFEQVVEALQPQRNLNHSPLFQVMFVFQNAPMGKLELPGLTITFNEINTVTSKFDLTLSMEETSQGLKGLWEYNTDLFDEKTIARMAGHFQMMLAAIVANPQQKIKELPLLSEQERHQLLVSWNQTQTHYPTDKCIHQLFEEQVQRTPDAMAVVFEDEQLTYWELNARANQLAHYLQLHGVCKHALVGICMERSLDLIISILGTLKAGGAYVPLDPAYPSERLAWMLEDAQVKVLLTQQQLIERLPERKAKVICLDEVWQQILQQNQENPVNEITSSHLAYVIYTSGSTGKPKGVLVAHTGLCNSVKAQINIYNVLADSRLLQFASFSFDVATADIFIALCTGATLCLYRKDTLLDTSAVTQTLREQSITHIQLPLPVLAALPVEKLPALQVIVVGGEVCPSNLVARWSSGRGFFNAYGPTEATVCSTVFECTNTSHEPPIGRPIANTQIYILDSHLQPVPIGVPGELYIGSIGLAIGYLNRFELTAEKFIPNPFSDEPGARLYKTGDLARYLPNGNIEYLGRIDNQVKVRGFRIELDEIEAALSVYPKVKQAVVITQQDAKGDKHLVAYIVPNQESPTTIDLRSFLKQKLPDYMVPAAFVFLDTLPLTPNGKVDRNALKAPDWEQSFLVSFVAPRTPTQQLIANIFAEVLQPKKVGIHDNFFELGGHSLNATQVVSRLRDSFNVELPLRCLFEFSTIAQLDEYICTVRLSQLGLAIPAIKPVPRDQENLPLSWAQARLWFLEQFEGATATYNIPAAVEITGALNINALEQSLKEIVRRHKVLRTSYHTVNGQPVQVISHDATVTMPIVDLQELPEFSQSTLVQRLATSEAQQPFDLSKTPLLRVSLLQLSQQSHVLLLTMHHIVADGWSMGIFIQELSTLYTASISGKPNPLPELLIQYTDFAVWQQQWLREQVLETQVNYWKQQLACAPPLLELPTDKPRPASQTFRGSSWSIELSQDLTQKLDAISRKSGVTLFMTLLAAFATLLWRYTRQDDILIGTPIANRNRLEVEPLIGFFVNTLVLRTQIQPDLSFLKLLKQVQQVTLQAYEHQDVPFEQVVEALQPERNLSYSPLFQVMFALQNAPIGKLELSDLVLTPLEIETVTSKFDLSLSMAQTPQGLFGSWVYNNDLFDTETIAQMARHFKTMLTTIVDNPQQPIRELLLLSETERHQLLQVWNQTQTNFPTHKCIHQLFEEQVQRTPDAVAVMFEDKQLTYRELNAYANKIAHYLQSLGVGPDVLVGLCVERSLELIIGLLGILKANAAYVPLDTALPTEGLSFRLQDTQVPILLTQQSLVEKFPTNAARIVCLDTNEQDIARQSPDNPQTFVRPENLIYVIFTSGSTGKPKGVAVEHRQVVNYLYAILERLNLPDSTSFATVSTIAADLGNTAIFSSLCIGGCLHIISEERVVDPQALANYFQRHPIDCLKIVPSHLSALVASSHAQSILPQRCLILGGEVASWDLIETIRGQAPNCKIFNHYGPTETTVGVLTYAVDNPQSKTIPVGRPLANTQVYVLDEQLQPVPIGLQGELYIGGVGIARGYLNRQEEQAQRFIPNPFDFELGTRLYKTGDLARYLPNGNIEFLGRIDNQVKIRGFRIELREIEAVLTTHPSVQQAVVIAKEDTQGDKSLVAYIVPNHELPTTSDLRSFLKQKLPDYMVPTVFVFLDTLPLTPNGKVNRRALRAPDWEHSGSTSFVPPLTLTQQAIANVIAEVLQLPQVGIHDNFFEIGGHSLKATQVISRLRETFRIELPLRCLFESPTVVQLDEYISTLRQTKLGLLIPDIEPVPRDTENLPLSWAQRRLWFIEQLQGSTATYIVPMAVQITGAVNINALEQSLREIVRRHEVLRTSYHTVNGQPVQVISHSATVTVPVVDLQELPESQQSIIVQRLCTLEIQQPFDLSQSPLLRITLLRLGQQSHVLLLTMHHIVSDAWSRGILIQELSILYPAFASLKPSPLTELSIQYTDFAVWQQMWLRGEVLETQLHYWKQQLAGAPPLLELPTDRPHLPVRTFRGRSIEFQLSLDLTEKLKTISQKSGVTLFMTLLAAFATLLWRYTRQDDILIGTPIANRNRLDIETLIGFFVNTLVLRTQIQSDFSFEKLLKQVQQVTLQAYEHQDIPFEQVVEALQPERNLSHSPLFQVMFALQNAPLGVLELPGLVLTPLEIETVISKFNLTLAMNETAQGLVGTWEYNTDLFNEETIARMAGHFQTMLTAIVDNKQQPIGELPLLSDAERNQLLVRWNETQTDYPTDKCIHQLFEEQVQRTPNAVAIVFEDQQFTYWELNVQANKIAHYLQSLGVGPEVLVGLCVERSVEMVLGVLGILKAGGAYVPLDPTYPQERLALMLQDSQVPLLVTQQHLVQMLPKHQSRVVCLDRDWSSIAQESQQNPVSGSTTSNLAYVIYTSGSTGKPKGTLVNHTNVVRLFAATQSWYNFNQQDVWTLFHSYAFDFSVWELWGALLYGGQLVVVPYLLSRSPEDFYKFLCTHKVTVLNQTPSAFRQLIRTEESLGTAKELSLRLVIFGGEALDLESLRPWFARHGDRFPQLVNMYGITETTVHVTYRPVTSQDLETTSGSIIGCPIPDLQVYLLDQYQQPVPIGVPGEMYIAGPGLARGYLNRPETTLDKFIPHPFSNNPSERLYKSGDLARYLPNGELEYLGRIDHQVKIRGFRIELGEIENTLAKHEAVQETVVLARKTQQGNKQLVAYVVPSNTQTSTTSDLRNFLLKRLPEYMVPSAFILLDKLPLTPNGKVNHRALPASDTARPDLEAVFVAPRTVEEKILAAIWAKVLDIEQVGIYDNFFALGGDSIRSIQVQSQAREQGLSFSIQQLFQYQTIQQLVENLTTLEMGSTIKQQIQPFEFVCEEDRLKLPDDLEDAYPLTQLQMGMLFHSDYHSESTTYHNVSSYHLQAPFQVQHFQLALQQLLVRHPVLRTSFNLNNFKEPLQLVHKVVDVPEEVEDLCHLDSDEQEKIITTWFETEKSRKFDWIKAPLWRIHIHRRSEKTFQFSLTEHHAILDGWSVASMITELFECYFSLLGEKVYPIQPPPAASFRDFVALEREAIAKDKCQRYWTEKLSDSSLTMLPRWSVTKQEETVQQVGKYEVPISKDICENLNQLARRLGVPLKSVFLAAHLRVLSLLSGQSDVVTGLVSNGRPEEIDGERTLGLFLNTLPYRLQLLGGTWIDLVKATFEAEQELLPFRRYPLAELQRVLGRKSLFETAFNFVNFHVYKNLLNDKDMKVLDVKSFAITNFAFSAQFSQEPSSSEVYLQLEYDTRVLCSQQPKAIVDYYLRTLTAIAREPEGRYESHIMLSKQETDLLLKEWNNTQAKYPEDQCIHQLFEAQVEQTPDAVAVVFEDQQITYCELNARANKLAHYLQSLGIGPEVLVGICLERSIEMVVGVLGILKAGGAYVPLDPNYPQQRLAFMLSDSQLSLLLTQQDLLTSLPLRVQQLLYLGRPQDRTASPQHDAQVVMLDTEWNRIAQHSSENPITQTTVNNQAYIIYTSGSTGKPKGVAIEHHNTVSLLHWATQVFAKEALAGVLASTSICFDLSVFELFVPLCWGGKIILVENVLQLQDLPASVGVTLINTVPSAIVEMLKVQGIPASVHTVNLAGEPLHTQLVAQLYELGTIKSVFDLYGPSEDTTYSTFALRSGDGLQTIGRPIANEQIYLLDSQLQPVPVGVSGELYIGGAGLARGYLLRPETNALKFIPNPFSEEPGARLYKTGDLARYLPDGNIQFLGRIDHQVKVRGFRIELGEIETVLATHSEIKEAVVIAREDQPGDKHLVAYVVPNTEAPLSSELRQFLKQKLPEYMLPSAFVMLEAMPRTPNGKVNRHSLPTPQESRSTFSQTFVAPRTPPEEVLVEMWAEILNIKEIGIYDDFFLLGGHSLLATQLVSQIRQAFDVKITIRHLFENPTVVEMVAIMSDIAGSKEIIDEIARTLKEMAELSPEEIQSLLSQERESVTLF